MIAIRDLWSSSSRFSPTLICDVQVKNVMAPAPFLCPATLPDRRSTYL